MTTSPTTGSTTSTTCTFTGANGVELSARLETPDGPVRATALFAHCFTCSKDLRVERQLTAALAAQGLAVLSFDFAGLGRSGGDFADSTFSADTDDLRAAAAYLAQTLAPPSLLVGHSLGGAAVLSVASDLPGVTAVATIGAPADPQHVAQVLDGDLASVRRTGSGTVTIAGRTFTIGRAFLEQLDQGSPRERLAGNRCATLLMHAPRDEVVGIENAELLYDAARHPKSFVSLDGADHLLSAPAEAAYAASVIATWAARYLPEDPVRAADPRYAVAGSTARNAGGFRTTVRTRGFVSVVDEPAAAGGTETGPTPYDHLTTALAACTVMTMRVYAEHKGWDVGELAATVTHERVHARDCRDCEATEGRVSVLDRVLRLPAGLTPEQRSGLRRIADRCPVHLTLEGAVEVRTGVADQE